MSCNPATLASAARFYTAASSIPVTSAAAANVCPVAVRPAPPTGQRNARRPSARTECAPGWSWWRRDRRAVRV